MYYCCKGCKNCCKSCGKCVDDCCSSCCNCCGSCCEDIVNCISKCFSRPFSFCAFIASFITFLPTILMIVALAKAADYDCEESMTKTALVVQGINNFVNFCFCLYIVFSYGKKYPGKNKEGSEEKNILQRTMNMIYYDFVVCFYVIALIFFIVWVCIGHNAYSNEHSQSYCSKNDNGFLMKILLYNLLSMDIFLIGGGIIFILCLIISACDEGSCTMYDTCRCMTLCCTCGCWDIGKRETKQNKEYNPNRVQYAQQNRQQYSDNRNTWLDKSKRLLAGFGLFSNNKNNNNNNNQQQREVVYHQQQQQQQQIQQQQIPNQNLNVYPPPSLHQNNPYVAQPQQQQYIQQNYQYPQVQQNQMPPPYQLQVQQQQVQFQAYPPHAPPPAQQMPPPQYGYPIQPQNPQHIAYEPNQNQNPYANQHQPEEQKKEKGFFGKAKDAAADLKNKLFK